jgi:hypothetical protein
MARVQSWEVFGVTKGSVKGKQVAAAAKNGYTGIAKVKMNIQLFWSSEVHTLNELIDQSVEQMPWARRRAYKRLLTMPRIRAEIVDHVASQIADEPCCSVIHAAVNEADFNGDVMLAVDPENLQKILDFILKILPLIIQIFFKV